MPLKILNLSGKKVLNQGAQSKKGDLLKQQTLGYRFSRVFNPFLYKIFKEYRDQPVHRQILSNILLFCPQKFVKCSDIVVIKHGVFDVDLGLGLQGICRKRSKKPEIHKRFFAAIIKESQMEVT